LVVPSVAVFWKARSESPNSIIDPNSGSRIGRELTDSNNEVKGEP